MNLAALSRRFCTSSTSRWRSPRTTGSGSATSTRTPRAERRPSTRGMVSRTTPSSGTSSCGRSIRPGARQLEQVLEEPAHAVGRNPDPAEVRLEPVEIPRPRGALDVAEESADRHQGALEIVRHDVGEALELRAARLELAIRLRQALPMGTRLGRPAHDLGDEKVHRHRGDHEDDRRVHERQPAEAARPGRLQGTGLLEPRDDDRRQDAKGRRGDEQAAVELSAATRMITG